MPRDPRYDLLFEPVQIGPKTARNRFYQVPHCNGMGWLRPQEAAAMRGVKAEGGWAVVCTEECSIHPSSDLTPYVLGRLWSDDDLPGHEMMVEAVHAHGALAGIQLVHNGQHVANYTTRLPPLAPSPMMTFETSPIQARAMDLEDIRELKNWYREAALRARRAGYDIIYVYAGHLMTVLMHFLLPRFNHRTDDYGGSFEGRLRLLREVLIDTREAVGADCAVALRTAVKEMAGDLDPDGLSREIIAAIASDKEACPDLFDVNVSEWEFDSLPSRFGPESSQEPFVRFVKSLTDKPVVGVGRFTSPDMMVRQIRSGALDFIGAARPSIADPFLPKKIEEGRIEDIRECIGCNICTAGDMLSAPIRCTQNPAMGEEYRKGWHPEHVPKAAHARHVLIVGGGPAGLEAALTAARAGHRVTLAEARDTLGGRVIREASLPGLSEWRRVADYRIYQLQQMENVALFTGSALTAEDVLEAGADHIAIATGAAWRTDGMGRQLRAPLPTDESIPVLAPDAVLAGARPTGRVLIFDDDLYYLASALGEALVAGGAELIFVTPASMVAPWCTNTLEQMHIQKRLIELGVEIRCDRTIVRITEGAVELACTYTGRSAKVEADTLIPVTMRAPRDGLAQELRMRIKEGDGPTLSVIGDAHAPGPIATAVYSGHAFAHGLTGSGTADRGFALPKPPAAP